MEPHKIETPSGASLTIGTSPFALDPGVDMGVQVFNHSERELGDPFGHVFASFSFNLTPDEADTLAAMLVAHAYDRRRQEQEREQPRKTYYKAPDPRRKTPFTAGPTYAAPPMTSDEQAIREAVEA